MTESPKSSRPSALMLIVSVAATFYFMWALFVAPRESPSFLMTGILFVLLVANIIFLVGTALRWRK